MILNHLPILGGVGAYLLISAFFSEVIRSGNTDPESLDGLSCLALKNKCPWFSPPAGLIFNLTCLAPVGI